MKINMTPNGVRQRQATQKVNALARRELAIELKAKGLSYSQIGKELGVSQKTAYYDVQKAADAHEKRVREKAENYIAVDLRTIDFVQRNMATIVQDAEQKASERSSAGNTVIKGLERRAKLLGYDAPDRIETTGVGGAPIQVENVISDEELERRLRAAQEALGARTPQQPVIDVKPVETLDPITQAYEQTLANRRNGNNGNG